MRSTFRPALALLVRPEPCAAAGRAVPAAPISFALPAAIAAACALAGLACAGDPLPMRSLAPDATYVIASADACTAAVERWKKSPIYAFTQTDAMKKVLGEDGGATAAMNARLKELGLPEDSLSWPEAAGMALYTVRNEELDADEAHMLIYGDFGEHADSMAKFFEATLAESVRKDGVKVVKDEVAGREMQIITLRTPEEIMKQNARGGAMGVQMDLTFAKRAEKIFYVRDGSRFFAATEIGAVQDALATVDGKRKSKLPEQADFRGAISQLGDVDLSVVILTGAMQKSIAGEGAGMLAMMQPVMQPLFGDVQAWTVGVTFGTDRGQLEVSSGIFVPGQRTGIWALLGPAQTVEAPPPMIGPDASGFGRINVQFKEFMNLVNTVAANLPEMQAQELDGMLVNFGPVLSKGFEAMGPGVWTYETLRQPYTPESRVSASIVACTNPKAVVPMIAQFGGTMGLEPRDVDGNTIFSAGFIPVSIGVSNGYVASGDSKLVEQAMRSMGQKDLPSIAENPSYKAAAAAMGNDPVISWGVIDLAARWEFERQMLQEYGKDDSKLDNAMGRADDSDVAKRIGYKLPANMNDTLKSIDGAMVAKYMGPFTWSMKSTDAGFVTRAWVMQPLAGSPEPAPKSAPAASSAPAAAPK